MHPPQFYENGNVKRWGLICFQDKGFIVDESNGETNGVLGE